MSFAQELIDSGLVEDVEKLEAIAGQDFAIVRTMVFLGAALYIASNVLIDVAYTWVDPRVRLS